MYSHKLTQIYSINHLNQISIKCIELKLGHMSLFFFCFFLLIVNVVLCVFRSRERSAEGAEEAR